MNKNKIKSNVYMYVCVCVCVCVCALVHIYICIYMAYINEFIMKEDRSFAYVPSEKYLYSADLTM